MLLKSKNLHMYTYYRDININTYISLQSGLKKIAESVIFQIIEPLSVRGSQNKQQKIICNFSVPFNFEAELLPSTVPVATYVSEGLFYSLVTA